MPAINFVKCEVYKDGELVWTKEIHPAHFYDVLALDTKPEDIVGYDTVLLSYKGKIFARRILPGDAEFIG